MIMATVTGVNATGNPEIDGLLYGTRWSGTVTYSFPDSPSDFPSGYGYGEPNAAGFSQAPAAMQLAVTYALGLVAGYTNLTILFAGTNDADIRVAQSSAANPTSYAYLPYNGPEGGDVWFGTQYNYAAAALGNYYFTTAIHELGHAFGLKHSQETGGIANVAVPAAHDDLEFTVMSYRSYVGGPLTGYTNESYGFPQTYMANDILALQTLYGANFNTHSENTVYSWSPNTGQEFINGVAQLAPGNGNGGSSNRVFMTVWDGNGVDTYDLSNYTTGVSINLNPGASSIMSNTQLAYLGNGHYAQGNIYNAYLFNNDARSYVENANGGTGNDTIIGNDVANTLNGGAGNDSLSGGNGNDALIGGPGNDTLDGSSGTDIAVFNGLQSQYQIIRFSNGSIQVADLRSGSPDGTDTIFNIDLFQFSDAIVSALNQPPAVVAADVAATKGQVFAASSLFSVSDADNNPITKYQFADGMPDAVSGHFVVNGFAQPANQIIEITASQLGQTFFQSGSSPDLLGVRAFDGIDWGQWSFFSVNAPINHAPVTTTYDITATKGQTSLLASALFSVSDADGDTITKYQLADGIPDTTSGYFIINGVAQPANQVIEITAAQLTQASFQLGTTTDTLGVRTFDGYDWGAWSIFHINPPVNHAPVVTASNVTAGHGQNFAFSTLFSAGDADGDTITMYQLADGIGDPASGHFIIDGAIQPANEVINLTAAQLAQTSFQSGSGTDVVGVRAFDGFDWGAWKINNVNAPVDVAPVVSGDNVSLAVNDSVAVSTLFSLSDAENDAILKFQFADGMPAASSAHFDIGSVTQAANQIIEVLAADVGQVYVDAGATAGLDVFAVRAYDSMLWSDWHFFNVTTHG
jgi:serralysin